MIALFDLSSRYRALPLGTGNKTERLFGYFTWHADDSPPINPLGDLFKTPGLGARPPPRRPRSDRHQAGVGGPDRRPDGRGRLRDQLRQGRSDPELAAVGLFSLSELVARGFDEAEVALVRRRLESTHWKRRLPTVAMLSPTAIGESYLRPVDY